MGPMRSRPDLGLAHHYFNWLFLCPPVSTRCPRLQWRMMGGRQGAGGQMGSLALTLHPLFPITCGGGRRLLNDAAPVSTSQPASNRHPAPRIDVSSNEM